MGTLPVILLLEQIKMLLLALIRWLGWGVVLKSSVHSFMTSVLAGLTRLNPLRLNTELNPPLRELTDTAHCQRSKRRPVITTNRLGQPIFSKRPLKPGPDRRVARVLQCPAHQQITREVVAEGQRITAPSVTQKKISLEVSTPDLIGSLAPAKRFTVRRHSMAAHTALDQPRTLEDLTCRGVRWPVQRWSFLTQIVQHLLRTPALTAKLSLNNHFTDFFGCRVRMTVRSPGTVSYTHLRAHETPEHLVCRLLLEKKKKQKTKNDAGPKNIPFSPFT